MLYCFKEMEGLLVFSTNINTKNKKSKLLYKAKLTGFPFINSKRRTQRWYRVNDEEEMLEIVGMGWNFTCAIISNAISPKLKHLIKGYEGMTGPNLLCVLNISANGL